MEDKVVDSRIIKNGTVIRRRRECLSCGKRFTSHEYIETMPIIVVKRDGSREEFQREKLLKGVRSACHKRPVSAERIEQLVDQVETEIIQSGESEVSSLKIGEKVMQKIHQLDEVAYVRFASVYREFRDVTEFEEILAELERLRHATSGSSLPSLFEEAK